MCILHYFDSMSELHTNILYTNQITHIPGFVCLSLTSLCHSNGHIETMPAREINPFTALTRIRSQFLRTQWSTSNHSEWTQLRIRPLSHRGWHTHPRWPHRLTSVTSLWYEAVVTKTVAWLLEWYIPSIVMNFLFLFFYTRSHIQTICRGQILSYVLTFHVQVHISSCQYN